MAANPTSRRRALLVVVAALLCLSALLAVAILLFGRFGGTEARILGTTALLAGYALLALPAAVLADRGRAHVLAVAVVALATAGATVGVVVIWWGDAPDEVGKSLGTATLALLAAAQTALLVARRSDGDPPSIETLFRVSCVLGAATATLWSASMWLGDRAAGALRFMAAVAVLDVLTVALQPLLARARPRPATTRLRLRLSSGETLDRDVAASDVGAAVARAIRAVEHDDVQVRDVEIVERAQKS